MQFTRQLRTIASVLSSITIIGSLIGCIFLFSNEITIVWCIALGIGGILTAIFLNATAKTLCEISENIYALRMTLAPNEIKADK